MSARTWTVAAIGAAVLFSALPAMGQGGGNMQPHWGMRHMMMGNWGDGPMAFGPEAMLDRIDGRLAFLKTELKITEAQTAAWDALAAAIRSTAETHNAMMRDMMEQFRDGAFLEKPLPERLQFQQSHLEARLEQVKAIRTAADALYAMLDDEQKNAADDIVLPMIGMGMGRGFGQGMMFR